MAIISIPAPRGLIWHRLRSYVERLALTTRFGSSETVNIFSEKYKAGPPVLSEAGPPVFLKRGRQAH